jgi:hypothetical protein
MMGRNCKTFCEKKRLDKSDISLICKEEAIKPGGAHLNVVYTTRISSNAAKGTWVDRGDKSTGEVLISGP